MWTWWTDNFKCWYYRKRTAYPHLAGQEGSFRQADELAKLWEDQGLDKVEKPEYDVLLSYPQKDDPNLVYLYDESNPSNPIFISARTEKILSPDQNHSDVVPPYNAYSPSGDVNVCLLVLYYLFFFVHWPVHVLVCFTQFSLKTVSTDFLVTNIFGWI